MKFKIVAVIAAALALSSATAGSAGARPLGSVNQPKSARPPQVNGVRLQAAMLPPSAFGTDFTFSEALNSGARLMSTRIKDHVPSMSCGAFEGRVYISAFGDTAGADVRYSNPDAASAYPDTIFLGDQYVLQFATAASAVTFYSQARAKYAACVSLTEPFIGTYTASVDTLSVTKTSVGGNQAFLVTQYISVPGYFEKPLYLLYLYVVAGTDVYGLSDAGGTNDEPSPALMSNLIHRVQALYPHH
jgi:hypothetical protein